LIYHAGQDHQLYIITIFYNTLFYNRKTKKFIEIITFFRNKHDAFF
jgi:hypothetical protein